jgi:glutaminyl-tRNA synthetase
MGGRVETRFPPEPNGYLHYGHAKSICLNFGLAEAYGGVCHMRFDDTNPEKEEQEYVDAILEAVQWLGFDWGEHLYFASDYFDTHVRLRDQPDPRRQGLCRLAVGRGDARQPRHPDRAGQGQPLPQPQRRREPRPVRAHARRRIPEGTHILRAKDRHGKPQHQPARPGDLPHPPRHPPPHRRRVVHLPDVHLRPPIEDAIENITHSVCTLEFEDQRPFYDWLLDALATEGHFPRPLPQQIEFARLNLTYVVLSKRKLIQLVNEGHVAGWDDPRLPTLIGARRRGFTATAFAASPSASACPRPTRGST